MDAVELYTNEDFVKQLLVMKSDNEVKTEFKNKNLNLTDKEFEELKKALRMVVDKNGSIVDDLMDQVCGPKWTNENDTNVAIRAIVHKAGKIISEFPFDFRKQFSDAWFLEKRFRGTI